MKKFIGVAVGLAITLATIGIFRVATSEAYDMYQENKINSSTNLESMFSEADKAEVKAEFMKACDTGELDGASFDQTAYCQCAMNDFLADYSYTELAKMGLNKTPEELEAIGETYAPKCLAEQGVQI